MQGFFEYEYLKYKKNHLQNLVALAKSDGHVHENEISFLYKIGEKYRLKEPQIKEILDKQEEIEPDIPNQHHQKIAALYDMTCMMMADNIIADAELVFMKKMCKKFGYKEALVFEMISLYGQKIDSIETWEDFLHTTEKYKEEK